MDRILKYGFLLLFLPLWHIQRVFPRKEHIWIFGAWNGQRFSDNSKYLFDYVTDHNPQIRAIWLTKNKTVLETIKDQGKESYLTNSIKGVIYSLRAKYIFVSCGKNDVNYRFINGATLIHLWHGNPLKKIGLDDNYSSVNGFFYSKLVRNFFPMAYEFNYDYMVSNSQVFTPHMQSSYSLGAHQILETGCPRNDAFFSTTYDSFNVQLAKKFIGAKIVYYLPTFRSGSTPKNIFTQTDYDEARVIAFLEEENMVLVNKGHFVETKKGLYGSSENSRIIHLKDSDITSDINFMLKDADGLITDYSSAFFDFLLTERPIVFAAFDLTEYMGSSRELYFDYEEAISGPVAKNWDEILYCLKHVWQDEDNKELIKQKNKLYNKFHDADNSKRVMNAVANLSKLK